MSYRKSELVLLFVLLALLMAACGCNDSNRPLKRPLPSVQKPRTPESKIASIDEIKAARPWKIAFVTKEDDSNGGYWAQVRSGAEGAGRDFGVEVTILPPRSAGSVGDQIRIVESLVREAKIDGLILSPTDTNLLSPVAAEAIAAGIPIIAHNSPLDVPETVTLVGLDDVAAGKMIGYWVVQQLGGSGQVLILDDQRAQYNSIERRHGILLGLLIGDIDVLGLQSGEGQRAQAKELTVRWLQEISRIDAILAVDDQMALGVADAVAEAGREGILISGCGADREALLAVDEGRLHATIERAPGRQARLAVQLMIRHLETGESFPPYFLWDQISLVTKGNVSRFLAQHRRE